MILPEENHIAIQTYETKLITDLQLQDSEEIFGQTLTVNMYSRRTLLHTSYPGQPAGLSQPVAGTTATGSSIDANVVMILAVLLCALICALGLNSIVRCALRCSSRAVVDAERNHLTRMAKGGLRRKALRAMPILVYSAGLKLHTACPMCAICLSDFEAGEHVKVLPKCNHGFHVRCIDRWLLARSTCPTCRQCLFGEPQKTSGCSGVSQADPARVHSVLVPLRPEGAMGCCEPHLNATSERRNEGEDCRSNHTAVLHHHYDTWRSNFRVVAKVQVSVSGGSIFSNHYQEIRSASWLSLGDQIYAPIIDVWVHTPHSMPTLAIGVF